MAGVTPGRSDGMTYRIDLINGNGKIIFGRTIYQETIDQAIRYFFDLVDRKGLTEAAKACRLEIYNI